MEYIICFSIDSENQYETWESFDNFLFEISELDHLVSTKEANHHVLSKYYPKKKGIFSKNKNVHCKHFYKAINGRGRGAEEGPCPPGFFKILLLPLYFINKTLGRCNFNIMTPFIFIIKKILKNVQTLISH